MSLFRTFAASFSLVNVFILAALLAILGAGAREAYQDYSLRQQLAASLDNEVRHKVIRGLVFAEAAKAEVERAYRSSKTNPSTAEDARFFDKVLTWNASYAGSPSMMPFVSEMSIDPDNGEITVEYNTDEIPQLAGANIMCLTPYANGSTLDTIGAAGKIEWGCSGESSVIATSRNLGPISCAGTVAARYSPDECR